MPVINDSAVRDWARLGDSLARVAAGLREVEAAT